MRVRGLLSSMGSGRGSGLGFSRPRVILQSHPELSTCNLSSSLGESAVPASSSPNEMSWGGNNGNNGNNNTWTDNPPWLGRAYQNQNRQLKEYQERDRQQREEQRENRLVAAIGNAVREAQSPAGSSQAQSPSQLSPAQSLMAQLSPNDRGGPFTTALRSLQPQPSDDLERGISRAVARDPSVLGSMASVLAEAARAYVTPGSRDRSRSRRRDRSRSRRRGRDRSRSRRRSRSRGSRYRTPSARRSRSRRGGAAAKASPQLRMPARSEANGTRIDAAGRKIITALCPDSENEIKDQFANPSDDLDGWCKAVAEKATGDRIDELMNANASEGARTKWQKVKNIVIKISV